MSQRSIVLIFIFLLILCGGMIIGSDFTGPIVREKLLPIATDGFKTVLGALVGALSVIAGVKSRE